MWICLDRNKNCHETGLNIDLFLDALMMDALRKSIVFLGIGHFLWESTIKKANHFTISKVVSTHLWKTPRATFTNRLQVGIPFIVGERGIARGVFGTCTVIFLDTSYLERSWRMDPFGAQFVHRISVGEMISQRATDAPNLSNGFAA